MPFTVGVFTSTQNARCNARLAERAPRHSRDCSRAPWAGCRGQASLVDHRYTLQPPIVDTSYSNQYAESY